MPKPEVSVITPAYNCEKYIKKAIESILNQSYKDFEYIVIDDQSTDKTWKIIKSFANKDTRIKAYINKRNLGIPLNRNRGIKLARGKYIVWQDADDISKKHRIKKLYEFMENNKEVGICGSYIQFFSGKKNLNRRLYNTKDNYLRKKIFFFSPVAQPSAMVRKECFTKLGGFDKKWKSAEDLEMSFRIGTLYKFANIPQILLKYRIHNRSITFVKLKQTEVNTIKIRKKYSKSKNYKMSHLDKMYNWIQYITIYLMPPKFRIKLFNFLRNTR